MALKQDITWPSVSVNATNPSVAPNGQVPSATSSTLVAGQDPSGDQQPLQTDASGNLLVSIDPSTQPFNVNIVGPIASGRVVVDGSQVTQPISAAALPLPTGAATSSLQTTGNTSLASIVTNTTGLALANQFASSLGAHLTASSTAVNIASDQVVPVSASALPLPSGAATASLQTTGNTSLASIDSKLTSPLAVTGPLTDAQLRATAVPVSAASLPLPTGAATEATLATRASEATIAARLSGALVPAAYNEIQLTYTGSNITTAVYKLAGSTVKTLTLSYTGSQLDSVVAS